MKQRQLNLDKIVAVQCLLNQIETLEDFQYNSIIVIETEESKKDNQYTLHGLSGFEENGILSFKDSEKIILKERKSLLRGINLEDIQKIFYQWQNDSAFLIDIALKNQRVRLLYSMQPMMVCIGA